MVLFPLLTELGVVVAPLFVLVAVPGMLTGPGAPKLPVVIGMIIEPVDATATTRNYLSVARRMRW